MAPSAGSAIGAEFCAVAQEIDGKEAFGAGPAWALGSSARQPPRWVQLLAKRGSQFEKREKSTDNAGIHAKIDALDP